jgi:hypothetical protein
MRWNTQEDLYYRTTYVRPSLDNKRLSKASGRRDDNETSAELHSLDKENGEAQEVASPTSAGVRY